MTYLLVSYSRKGEAVLHGLGSGVAGVVLRGCGAFVTGLRGFSSGVAGVLAAGLWDFGSGVAGVW